MAVDAVAVTWVSVIERVFVAVTSETVFVSVTVIWVAVTVRVMSERDGWSASAQRTVVLVRLMVG